MIFANQNVCADVNQSVSYPHSLQSELGAVDSLYDGCLGEIHSISPTSIHQRRTSSRTPYHHNVSRLNASRSASWSVNSTASSCSANIPVKMSLSLPMRYSHTPGP